jgi:predicted metal-dependent hydrolase
VPASGRKRNRLAFAAAMKDLDALVSPQQEETNNVELVKRNVEFAHMIRWSEHENREESSDHRSSAANQLHDQVQY